MPQAAIWAGTALPPVAVERSALVLQGLSGAHHNVPSTQEAVKPGLGPGDPQVQDTTV